MSGPTGTGPGRPDAAGAAPKTFTEVLASRRMCRDFTDEPPDAALVDAVLHAGFRAPAAGNTAALDLVVLTGERVDAYWATTMDELRRSDFAWPGLLRAPVLVLPYVDPAAYVRRYAAADKAASGLGDGPDAWTVPYWWIDGGAAVMAMLLAAESVGLGALFFGQFDHEGALRDRFTVPAEVRGLGTLALGHPAPGGRRPSRSAASGRPGAAGRVHRGGW